MIRWIKNYIKYLVLKKRFPYSEIYFGALIDNNSNLGKNSVVFSNTVLINSTLDDYSYIQKNSEIINSEIGKFCSIASNVTIGLANHPTDLLSTSPVFYDNTQPLPYFLTNEKLAGEFSSKTFIASDVWIGQSVMIKAGISIGVGAVIGAGAVVTKDVAPYSIVAGVPAKHIRYRFDKNSIDKLLESKWWDLKEEELKKYFIYFNKKESKDD